MRSCFHPKHWVSPKRRDDVAPDAFASVNVRLGPSDLPVLSAPARVLCYEAHRCTANSLVRPAIRGRPETCGPRSTRFRCRGHRSLSACGDVERVLSSFREMARVDAAPRPETNRGRAEASLFQVREQRLRGRLLIVSNFFPPNNVGGAEIVAFRQAKMMRTEGWDVRVFSGDFNRDPKSNNSNSLRYEDVDGVRVIRALSHPPNVGSDVYDDEMVRHFAVVLREFKPSIVHFHHLGGLGVGLLDFAKRAGTKAIVTLHDRWGFCFKGTLLRNDFSACLNFTECFKCLRSFPTRDGALPIRLRNDYIMSMLNLADTVIAPSLGLADDYIQAGLSQDRIEVVSSGIDLAGIAPRPRDPSDVVHFLCPAYIGEHKGFRELLDALGLLFSDRSLRGRWTFWIAGSGHLEAFMRSQIAESGLNRHVILSGHLPHPRLLARLSVSDVVVLPSICAENQPRAILEGIASGAALVASRVKGNVELVQHAVNGLLYEPSDPAALAAALRQLIVSRGLIQAFSQANLSLRAHYDERQTASRLTEIYEAPAGAVAATDLLVRCGIAAPGRKVALSGVEQAPRMASGKKVRLIWWRWVDDADDVSSPLWVFRVGWRPWRWLAAYRRHRTMYFSKTLDLTTDWSAGGASKKIE